MRIGNLAHRAGVDVQTVRFYERKGLLAAPTRTPGGFRVYGPQHLAQLVLVRHCRSLDISLPDVKRLLALAGDRSLSCDDVSALVQAHLERVRAKRAALEALESKLSALRAQCSSGRRVADCGILECLLRAASSQVPRTSPQ